MLYEISRKPSIIAARMRFVVTFFVGDGTFFAMISSPKGIVFP